MHNYYFDIDGCYCDCAPANPETLPPENALRLSPPKAEGFVAVTTARRDGWELLPDHRGRKGWLNGIESIIAKAGALPTGWSDNPPDASDTRTYREKRMALFICEADPLCATALSYQSEAAAWLLLGDSARADAATAKAEDYLKKYVEEKERIRIKYPAQN